MEKTCGIQIINGNGNKNIANGKELGLKIFLVASECVPFIKTGGLADVVGALPAALKKLGIDGAIAGKAVYTGTLDLAKAIKEAE